ncbi:unnamed protein product [Bursaphelenchus xylophilus]|uniref:Polypeptide N-acetylgalactosaminyltransferase n=1 Tax=Bursaphelenchus xylophilus TaxID=6326 RepID=A0A1I7RQP7_BURXY|nr:unnamed protein product [Bursaphelenchus xylophilus]CAG9104927.1 unnamed protein product [Bursaphelenchus xylophilus]
MPRIPIKWLRVVTAITLVFFIYILANLFNIGPLESSFSAQNSNRDLENRAADFQNEQKTVRNEGKFSIIDYAGEGTHFSPEEYEKMEARMKGPGEQGAAVQLTGPLKEAGEKSKKEWFMNLVASDKISLDRSLRDQRHQDCRILQYDARLPAASVIIVFTDEAWTPLLRTVHSVFNRTPRNLLHQVVIVDDFSQREDLHEKLEEYLARFGSKLRLVRSKERLGLIRARATGAKYATGEVIIFLDAHCEASKGWIEPLLQRLKDAPYAFICPVIDSISDQDMEYQGGSAGGIGSFWWSLHYKMDNIPEAERKRRKNPHVDLLLTPTMAGGLFAVRRDTFFEFGAYDEEMDIWGGENLEISFRAWMCGGSVEIIPCSHVGHIYRNGHPYNMTGRGGNKDVHGTNSKRLAEVWMDDYKKFYYLHRSELKNKDVGDLTPRHALRRSLNCKSFKWYLHNVAYEKFIPDENVKAYGRVKNPHSGLCFDTLQRNEFKHSIVMGVYHCQYPSSSAQMFSLTNDGILRRETVCSGAKTEDGKEKLDLQECGIHGNGKVFEYRNGHLKLTTINKCLTVENLKAGDDLHFDECKEDSKDQLWEFEAPDL